MTSPLSFANFARRGVGGVAGTCRTRASVIRLALCHRQLAAVNKLRHRPMEPLSQQLRDDLFHRRLVVETKPPKVLVKVFGEFQRQLLKTGLHDEGC